MKKTVLAATTLFVAALSLTACTDGKNSFPMPAPDAETSPRPAPATTVPAEINTPFKVAQYEGDDVTMTVREITVGQECRYGTLGEEYGPDIDTNSQVLLQVWAEVEATTVKQDFPEYILAIPKTLDADGFTTNAWSANRCKDPTDNYGQWFDATAQGTKTRRYGAFAIPKGSTQLKLESGTFTLPAS
ncbi:hypothetical protein [Corynebacterium vitaeruminis]|uniref:Secreted protein n=1 Tax=Corynebacterium vitaeruminis DSM 20294 TaxID=1224164 RepID=W5XZL6_9CORY|nr:hypothetical protein [Corynebacterium vitaeruminis]AHI22154.1 hypothetical protein B843_03815 [Corynebacterium vitaeruminis DSM 20294]